MEGLLIRPVRDSSPRRVRHPVMRIVVFGWGMLGARFLKIVDEQQQGLGLDLRSFGSGAAER